MRASADEPSGYRAPFACFDEAVENINRWEDELEAMPKTGNGGIAHKRVVISKV